MENKKIKYYKDSLFKAVYLVNETCISFDCFRIRILDEDLIEESEVEEKPTITGVIKWDGCMNFNQDDHYCEIHHAAQTFLLMKEIYDFNDLMQKERS